MISRARILASGPAMLFSLMLVQTEVAEAAVSKYKSEGAGAWSSWSTSCSHITIDVSDSNVARGQDFLYYWGINCDNNYFEGYGEVPGEVVKSEQGGKTVSLSVDVNTLQGYWHYGTPLTATMTWKLDATCSDKGGWHGQSTYNHDGQSFTYRYNGTYSSSCADVAGNIGGPVSFSGSQEDAQIYSHRSINREFVRP